MSTSVIDYIFRELAITYLGRYELGQVMPEDLQSDAVGHSQKDSIADENYPFDDSEDSKSNLLSKGEGSSSVSTKPAPLSYSQVLSKKERLSGPATAVADNRETAIIQGYTGDSCIECGSFQMVRNGSCLKCNSCGATTGCS